MTQHYPIPLRKARFWLAQAREAIRAERPLLALEPSHTAVHNAVVALRGLRSGERGKVGHPHVAAEALRLGVPASLAEGIQRVEGLKAPYEYGPQMPTKEDGERFYRVAEDIVAYVEKEVKTRSQGGPPARERKAGRPRR